MEDEYYKPSTDTQTMTMDYYPDIMRHKVVFF